MNVRAIVYKYLTENGFDGLHSENCGCENGDLMPCDEYSSTCEPGYKTKCNCGEGCRWHITSKKQEE